MALYDDGDPFGFNQANRLLTLQASTQDLTDPGLNEVQISISGDPPELVIYTPTKKIVGGTALQLLAKILTVDGSGSGLDADKLDAKEGSFYRNAGNLNAGNMPRARFGELSKNNDNNNTDSPFIQWGTGDGYNDTIVFANQYSEVPVVLVSLAEDTQNVTLSTLNRSSSQFTIRCRRDSDGVFQTRQYIWLAIGKRL